jgi:CDP-glucose 4,6-dehydratase
MLEILQSIFKDKKVFLTGHTGFKGAWMLQVLNMLGADVKGFSLDTENHNDLFNEIDGASLCYSSVIGDIRDANTLKGELIRFAPDFVFHLAAQALVRTSYAFPAETFNTNVIGTVHILDAIRMLEKPCIGVMITTDKVYENPERGIAFNENDRLGGYDPYSASKAAAEIAIASYTQSFFNPKNYDHHKKAIASARAGNVIGGGDRAKDRIVPDIVKALQSNAKVTLRNPDAVRPWQHVLEPIAAYLLLAAKMTQHPRELSTSFNFGPEPQDNKTVEEITKIFLNTFGKPDAYNRNSESADLHEANLLTLDSTKAKQLLDWKPQLTADSAIQWTADWYADTTTPAIDKCQRQIEAYFGINSF